jgi:hypothetical protein
MAHAIKVLKISEGQSQVDNASYIHVLVEVYRDGVSLGERSYGYPLGTTPEEIKENLAKMASTLDSDEEVGKRSAELEEALKSVGAAGAALTGLQVGGGVPSGGESGEE